MVDSSWRLCCYWCGFVYVWYHAITKQKFCTFLLFSKPGTFKLKSPAETICLFTVSFFEKRFLKVVFYISIRESYIVLRIRFLHFLFKISMLKDFASESMSKSCRLLKDNDLCTNILIPPPLTILSYLI